MRILILVASELYLCIAIASDLILSLHHHLLKFNYYYNYYYEAFDICMAVYILDSDIL